MDFSWFEHWKYTCQQNEEMLYISIIPVFRFLQRGLFYTTLVWAKHGHNQLVTAYRSDIYDIHSCQHVNKNETIFSLSSANVQISVLEMNAHKWKITQHIHIGTFTWVYNTYIAHIVSTLLFSFNTGFAYAHLSLVESAGAVGFPSSVQCSRCAGLCKPPAGGDRAFGATCELSAGSFHWAHKSFPAEKETQRKCQPLCRSAVTSQKTAFLNDGHAHILELYRCRGNSCAGLSLTSC